MRCFRQNHSGTACTYAMPYTQEGDVSTSSETVVTYFTTEDTTLHYGVVMVIVLKLLSDHLVCLLQPAL